MFSIPERPWNVLTPQARLNLEQALDSLNRFLKKDWGDVDCAAANERAVTHNINGYSLVGTYSNIVVQGRLRIIDGRHTLEKLRVGVKIKDKHRRDVGGQIAMA